jgi:hypothetical protein
MSRGLARMVHLRPQGQVRQCTGSSRKLAGQLSGRASGRGACLIRVQLERSGLRVVAQTEPENRPDADDQYANQPGGHAPTEVTSVDAFGLTTTSPQLRTL